MKLCTFEVRTPLGRQQRAGAVLDGGILDLNFGCASLLARRGEPLPHRLADALVPAAMLEFLDVWSRSFPHALEVIASVEDGPGPNGETLLYRPEEVRVLAPLPNPRSLRDFYAFEGHVKKGFEKRGEPMPQEWYEMPVYYKSGHHNIIGSGEDVLWPSFTEKFDYELELAAIIGKQGRNIPAERAREHIAGFTVMNDFSARDIQRKEMKVRLGPAKGKDWATALGPWLVTADELPNPYELRMTARVNGELWSNGNSGSLFWRFEQMIEFLSRDDTIYPGDVLGSGTVATGCGLELDRWVQSGDVIELEIEKIGVLRNRVVRHGKS
ncbi:MAG: fumarylacetoacetate hydrolase family protein [Bryobacteraceae bacterium]|nr:fumarylacetoacetate hydrolase family protein [Bryobacteraceae bacterium]